VIGDRSKSMHRERERERETVDRYGRLLEDHSMCGVHKRRIQDARRWRDCCERMGGSRAAAAANFELDRCVHVNARSTTNPLDSSSTKSYTTTWLWTGWWPW